MNDVVVLSHYWAAALTSAGQEALIAQLKARLVALGPLPAKVVLVSAGEVCTMLDEAAVALYHWLASRTDVSFVSAACASLHGAILDFYHSGGAQTVVIALELGKLWQQSCLDALGIGTSDQQDGLDVVPGIGFMALKRQSQNLPLADHELWIEQCQLWSQPPGFAGTQSLVKGLSQLLRDLPATVLPVSFDIRSDWGKSLLRGVAHRLADRRLVDSQLADRQLLDQPFWLPSVESGAAHYLSLKPLFELQLYQDALATPLAVNNPPLDQKSLLLLTLGGGGRIGILQLGRSIDRLCGMPEVSVEDHSMAADLAGLQQAMALYPHDQAGFFQQIRATLKYPRSRYRGCNNHYFKWPMAMSLADNNRTQVC